jgi:hypothetical protein
MSDLAQIDRIISEINNLEEKEKIVFFHKIEDMLENFDDKQPEISIETAFGLWKDRNISKETLRNKAWMKN